MKNPTMGARLRRLREAQTPKMSIDALTVRVCMLLPTPLWISAETLRRLEADKTPETDANPLLIMTIAEVLGCRVSEISPVVAEHVELLRERVTRTNLWISAPPLVDSGGRGVEKDQRGAA